MSISILSHENKTASGTITIPQGCTLIYGFVIGSETAPSINSVNMVKVDSKPAVGQVPALGIWKINVPECDVKPFLLYGTSIEFVYLTNALDDRGSPVSGYGATGSVTGNLTTITTDLAFGFGHGLNAPISLKGDTVAMTYLVDSTLYKIGYITPGDTSLTCLAEDGTTVTYQWQPQSPIYHGSVLVSAAWVENLPAIHHNGYWYTNTYYPYTRVWVPPWDEYPQIYHPAVYSDAWTEYPPDILVPVGTPGQINAIFCAVKKKKSKKKMTRWM